MGNTFTLALPYPENTDPLAHVSDAIEGLANAVDYAIGGPMAPWVPALTNFDVGDGSVLARYKHTGHTLKVRALVTGGAGAAATGIMSMSLPAGFGMTPAGADDEQFVHGVHWDGVINRPAWALVRSTGLHFQSTSTGSWVSAFENGHTFHFQGEIETL